MGEVQKKVENALNEARTLVLVVHILLGFQFRSTFETSFEKLPAYAKDAKLFALAMLLVATALLLWPAARHRIVERGVDTWDFHEFVSRVATVALIPFALALGVDGLVAGERIVGPTFGAAVGVGTALVALTFWYGIEAAVAGRVWPPRRDHGVEEPTKLEAKVKEVLTEIRVVVPGVQALLGFQLATILMEGFEKLPNSSKYVHLGSLAMLALSAILLMTPPAYHRIVEDGEDTERFHKFANRFMVASMVPLALGIGGDVYVVFKKVLDSTEIGIAAAALTELLFFALWFGYSFWVRARRAPGFSERMTEDSSRWAA